MISNTLELLSQHDWELLREKVRRIAYRQGEVILEEGAYRRALFIVHRGVVRVEQAQQGRGIALAQLGPGEIFGEMGFVENVSASASIVAQEDIEVDVVDEAHLQSVLASNPGFAIRFYQSLAVSLARRLRATSRRLVQANVNEVAQVNRFHQPRTGNISAQQIPQDLAAAIDAFEQVMLAVDQGLRNRKLGENIAQARVSTACDEVIAALERHTDSESLLEIGWVDLLSFRDTPQLASGVGDYVFRETFSVLMLSATLARCYTKPHGFADDYETIAMIYRNDAEGDDRLGPLIDHWFLERPLCRSRRNSYRLMTERIKQAAAGYAGPAPMRVTSLASGTAQELFDLYAGNGVPTVYATCIDVDTQALLAAARLAEHRGYVQQMTFLQGNVVLIVEGQEQMSLPPQQVIYALGFCDYLSDEQFTTLLNWAYDHLLDGGSVVLTNLDVANPDRQLMEHILEWKLNHRTPGQLGAIVARSKFGHLPLDIQPEESGVTLFVTCTKPR